MAGGGFEPPTFGL